MITGGARLTSLTAEIEAGEVAIVKYFASCYRRAFDECSKWKVWSLLALSISSLYYTCLLGPSLAAKAEVSQKYCTYI